MSPIALLSEAASQIPMALTKTHHALSTTVKDLPHVFNISSDQSEQHLVKMLQYWQNASNIIEHVSDVSNGTQQHLSSTLTNNTIYGNINLWITFGSIVSMVLLVIAMYLSIQKLEVLKAELRIEVRLNELEKVSEEKKCVSCLKREEGGGLDETRREVVEKEAWRDVGRMEVQIEEREEDRGVYTMWPNGPWRG